MADTPNEKAQIDRSGLTINTDPDADAAELAKRERPGIVKRGIEQHGGGDHGKTDKGVKIIGGR